MTVRHSEEPQFTLVTGVPSPPLSVLLVDRSRLFAEILQSRLVQEHDVERVRIATSAQEALRVASEQPFSVVVAAALLAVQMFSSPERQGWPPLETSVIVIADPTDLGHARELMQHGVVGWVGRERSCGDLVEAIHICRRGGVCVPSEVLLELTRTPPPVEPVENVRDRVLSVLTAREVEVFTLLEKGMGRAEIAEALHLSPNTVRTHVHRILRRLDVHSTLAALALVRAGDRPS